MTRPQIALCVTRLWSSRAPIFNLNATTFATLCAQAGPWASSAEKVSLRWQTFIYVIKLSVSTPKHTMPSIPRPIHTTPSNQAGKKKVQGPPLVYATPDLLGDAHRRKPSERLRGPWDHSECIGVVIDVEQLLAPLKPAVVRRCSI